MSQFHSPGIVRKGLTFQYDMKNTLKSWKGAPTTNYVTNAASFSGWSNYWRTDYINTFQTEFGTTGYRITGNPSWNGLNRTITVPSTGTYTFSAWFRYWGGTSSNNGAQVYVSGYGGGDTAVGIDKSKIGIWQRISITLSCTTTSFTFYLISYGGDSTGRADCSTWDVTMPQVEAGSIATGFVDGTRSTTQSLIDLTGNNTTTIGSLSYNSDGTFYFNKSSNYIDINNTSLISGNNPFTIEAEIYVNSASGGQAIIGNYGSGYTSNYLWFATHGLYLNTASPYFSGGQLAAGTYIIAVTREGNGTTTLYKNAVVDSTSTNTANISTGINWRIGCDVNGTGEPFGGNIYAVRVYNRALSALEIKQNFNARKSIYGL